MKFTAKIVAEFLHGEVKGNPDTEVSSVSKIEEGTPGTLAFLANPKYTHHLYTTKASIVLVNRDFVLDKPVEATLILVDNAYESFASLLDLYAQSKPRKSGIHPTAIISPSAQVGENAYIGAYAVIEDGAVIGNNVSIYPHVYVGDKVRIGNDCTFYSGVKIYEECVLGNRITIHAGTIIGADGFGFAPQNDHQYKKVPQIGNVLIEDDVEIGANTCVDRSTMGSTIIRRGVKLDNLIQIAHNVEIGKNTVIAGSTAVAGSTKVGSDCMIGGHVSISGHISIANGTKIGGKAGVNSSIEKENQTLIGAPAIPFVNFMKSSVLFNKFPQIYQQINKMEKELAELKKTVENKA
jgi:UDP-3-O-[3-hydroxymyristoyl] glucosamine N-acyltransferase